MTDFLKADVPDDPSQWTRTTIVEDVDTPEEHGDEFYRCGGWGIEKDKEHGYELYAVIGDEPIMVKDGFASFEEAVAFIRDSTASKRLEGEDPAATPAEKPEAPVEKPEAATAVVIGVEPEVKPEPEKKAPTPEPKPTPEKRKVEPTPEKKVEKKEEPAFPTFKSLMEKKSKKVDLPPQVESEDKDGIVVKPYYPTVRIGEDKSWPDLRPRTVSGPPKRT